MMLLRLARLLSLVLLALALTAGVALVRGWSGSLPTADVAGVDVGLRLDVLPVILLAFVASVTWLVATFCLPNLQGQARVGRFGALLMLATASLALLVTGASLPVMAVGWTASGVAIALLVEHAGRPSSRRAARYVRRSLLAGDLALWIGVVMAVVLLPTVNRADLQVVTFDVVPASAVASVLLVACIVRSGLFPMHRWLPETAEAPSPVSAFLHAGIINGAGVLVALMWPLFAAAPVVLLALIVVGIASVAIGTWAARVRRDVKGQLACSTTAQMGYMAIQLGLGLPAAAVLHLIGHGYYKGWLFLRAGGAVTRARRKPLTAGRLPASPGPILVAVAVAVGGLLVALPAVLSSVSSLGLTATVPALLAITAATVAVMGAIRVAGSRRGAVALVAVLAAVAVAGYAWGLMAWENLLAGSLPLSVSWAVVPAAAIIVVLVAAGAGIARVAVVIVANPAGPMAARLAGTTLPPWLPRLVVDPLVLDGLAATRALTADSAAALVQRAARLTAPAWPLRTVVAASALAGLEDLAFDDAAVVARDRLGGRSYLPLPAYLQRFDEGRISRVDLHGALAELAPGTDVDAFVDRCRSQVGTPIQQRPAVLSAAVLEHAGAWCARAWATASDESGDPWAMWRTAVEADWLPADPAAALGLLLGASGLPEGDHAGYVEDVLVAGPGWSSHAAWRVRRYGRPEPLVQLAALRAALDLLDRGGRPVVRTSSDIQHESDAAIWQAAFERGYRGPLVADLVDAARGLGDGVPADAPRDEAQLVMCIDVRSERMRRHLEAVGRYQTFGFAGFFGAAVRYRDESGDLDLCPVLINPTHTVVAVDAPPSVRSVLRQAVGAMSAAPVTPLLVAEAGGVLSGLAGLGQSLIPVRWRALARRWGAAAEPWGARRIVQTLATDDPSHPTAEAGRLPIGFTLEERVALAGGALRAIGLVDGFAPLIVICGHSASVENNAFAAAYDCGACGGNGGQISARVLADALNDPAVRRALSADGIVLPIDTIAVPAAHDTTLDVIEFEPGSVPDSHRVLAGSLEDGFRQAKYGASAERVRTLPGARGAHAVGPAAARQVLRRGVDWAQPCPEWGLAGNAAFVVGPRSLTAGLDLGGRVFLHSYDPSLDPDLSTLELILTAPVVVAQWINAQYYLSTVDPERFGAGDKATHNVVGDVGVLTGAHGDLRTGLPWQALFTADPRSASESGVHEPLRLQVVVHAGIDGVRAIVERNEGLRSLVVNGWISVVVIDPDVDGAVTATAISVTEPRRSDSSIGAALR